MIAITVILGGLTIKKASKPSIDLLKSQELLDLFLDSKSNPISVEQIEQLIRHGADVNGVSDRKGWPPLMFAVCYNENIEVTKLCQ